MESPVELRARLFPPKVPRGRWTLLRAEDRGSGEVGSGNALIRFKCERAPRLLLRNERAAAQRQRSPSGADVTALVPLCSQERGSPAAPVCCPRCSHGERCLSARLGCQLGFVQRPGIFLFVNYFWS